MPCLSGGIKDTTGNCDLRVKIPPRAPGRKPKQLNRPHIEILRQWALCGPMGQSLKGKSSPFKDRYRFESCKTQDHEVISPLKRKPYSFSQGLPPGPAARIITIFPLKIFWQSQGKTRGKIAVISQKQKLPTRTNFQKVPTRTNFQPKPSVSAHGAKKAAPLRHPQLHKPNHHACPLGQQGDPVHGMIAQKKSSQMKDSGARPDHSQRNAAANK